MSATIEELRQKAEQVRADGIAQVTSRLDECRRLDREFQAMQAQVQREFGRFGLTINLFDLLRPAAPQAQVEPEIGGEVHVPEETAVNSLAPALLLAFADKQKEDGFTTADLLIWAEKNGYIREQTADEDKKVVSNLLLECLKLQKLKKKPGGKPSDPAVYVHEKYDR